MDDFIHGGNALMNRYVIAALSDMRGAVAMILDDLPDAARSDEARLFNIRLVLNELITNAFIHGNARMPGEAVTVMVDCHEDGSLVDIAVEDAGRGGASRLTSPAQPTLEDHGRGLVLVRALAREVAFSERGSRVWVRMNM